MGSGSVEAVIAALTAGGLRAAAAWPGQKMPQLTSAAAAVCLKQYDTAKQSTTVRVTVWCPFELGGSACEAAAIQAAGLLEEIGAGCVVEQCRYDGAGGLFYMPVDAVFLPAAKEESGPEFTVKLGTVPLDYTAAFTAQQVTEDPAAVPLTDAAWTFRLEEAFPAGAVEQNAPTEPFSITVSRPNVTEIYQDCYLTSVSREDGETGLSQVRTGTAAKRSYISIL